MTHLLPQHLLPAFREAVQIKLADRSLEIVTAGGKASGGLRPTGRRSGN